MTTEKYDHPRRPTCDVCPHANERRCGHPDMPNAPSNNIEEAVKDAAAMTWCPLRRGKDGV
jgi:hypothetical protein